MGLIIFGLIFVVISIVARFTTIWKVSDTSKCVTNDTKLVKENKINFYIILGFGSLLILSGIIYLICTL
jgi:hypothetical protein